MGAVDTSRADATTEPGALAADDALRDKAAQGLERRAFASAGALKMRFALVMGTFIWTSALQHNPDVMHQTNDWSKSEARPEGNSLAGFFSVLVPEFVVMLAINSFLAAYHPKDLGAREVRSTLVPLCVVRIIGDLIACNQLLEISSGGEGNAGAHGDERVFVRRRIHLAYVLYCLAVMDGYMITWLYIVQGYTSWSWYRMCMIVAGFSEVFITSLLHWLGETHYPPCGVGLGESLARPAVMYLVAAIFNPRVRQCIHRCSIAAGFQHMTVNLRELKCEEVHSYTRQLGGRPTAAGNESPEESSTSVDDDPECCSVEQKAPALRAVFRRRWEGDAGRTAW